MATPMTREEFADGVLEAMLAYFAYQRVPGGDRGRRVEECQDRLLAHDAALRARLAEAEAANATLVDALGLCGVNAGHLNGVPHWWHVAADDSEPVHATVAEAAEAVWQVRVEALALRARLAEAERRTADLTHILLDARAHLQNANSVVTETEFQELADSIDRVLDNIAALLAPERPA